MERRYYVPLRRRHDIQIRRREDELLRRLGEVPLRRRWVFHLRRTCDVQRDVTISPRRRFAGWEVLLSVL